MMAERLDHEDTMKLAVQLACSYLSDSSSGSTSAEDLILNYYRQLRSVEARLQAPEMESEMDEAEARAAA
jgi:hypothetical protein